MELWDILDGEGNKTGKTIERGKRMGQDEYHLLVQVWIKNSNGEFLITKRSPNKKLFPNMWATQNEIQSLIEAGEFANAFPCLEDLFKII